MRVALDIETLTVNRSAIMPSDFVSIPYSVAYVINDSAVIHRYHSIEKSIVHISESAKRLSKNKVKIYAHNGSKYDFHFILKTLKKMSFSSYVLSRNNVTYPDDAIYRSSSKLKNRNLLEFRYKTSNRLTMIFKFNDIVFELVDTFPKVVMPLEAVGRRLNYLDLLDSKYLKTSYDYTKYDLPNKLEETDLDYYSEQVFNSLSESEIEYIENDVIILQTLINNFDKFLSGFSLNEMAINGNVINKYTSDKKDRMATYHILNTIYDKRADGGKVQISYSDYRMSKLEISLFKFLKLSYRGGVCYYNDRYLDKTITEKMYAYDINSSYPSIYFTKNVPHSMISNLVNQSLKLSELSYNTTKTFSVVCIKKSSFMSLINKMNSTFRKINIGYYRRSKDGYFVNSLFIDECIDICGIPDDFIIDIVEMVTFNTRQWGGKRYLKEFYEIKQNSKRFKKKRLVLDYDTGIMHESDDTNNIDQSDFTDVSKVLLNAIYGASGIADYVDFFYTNDKGEITRAENGIKNNERNVVMSLFVTAGAKYNLLYPLSTLSEDELDESFIYCDTDSLYVKSKVSSSISKLMKLDDNDIGAWGIDSDNITKFKVLNHKLYSYYDSSKNKLVAKTCGVSKKKVNDIIQSVDNDFDSFTSRYFKAGGELPSLKSILNKYGTISIYDSVTVLKLGHQNKSMSSIADDMMFDNTIIKLYNSFNSDILNNDDIQDEENAIVYYISGGSYSRQEIISIYNEIEGNKDEVGHLLNLNELINIDYPNILKYLNKEVLDIEHLELLVNSLIHNSRKSGRYKFECTVKSNHTAKLLETIKYLELNDLETISSNINLIYNMMTVN